MRSAVASGQGAQLRARPLRPASRTGEEPRPPLGWAQVDLEHAQGRLGGIIGDRTIVTKAERKKLSRLFGGKEKAFDDVPEQVSIILPSLQSKVGFMPRPG